MKSKTDSVLFYGLPSVREGSFFMRNVSTVMDGKNGKMHILHCVLMESKI